MNEQSRRNRHQVSDRKGRRRATPVPTKRRKRRLLPAFAVISSALIGAMIGGLSFLLRDTPPLNLSAFTNLSSSTLVFARDHKTLLGRYAAAGDRRPLHALSEAGAWVADAFIAAEDRDFYHHIGVDPLAIVRSAWTDMRKGYLASGGSTITQQTVKLALFPMQERTWRRKTQELALAIGLERVQTKPQILLEYLNALYFGTLHGVHIYGVQSAALHLFGQPANHLTAAQAALVAAIPNNPSLFSVETHPELVKDREQRILRRMHQDHELTDSDYASAMREPVLQELSHSRLLSAPYESHNPFIAAQVRHLAPLLIASAQHMSLEDAERLLETGGLHIYTSIDPTLQTRLDAAVAARNFAPPIPLAQLAAVRAHGQGSARALREQVGAVVIENDTSRVVAECGGRDFGESEVDHATAHRQPGSALKPLAVYGPAIERRIITPASILDDAPHHYPDPNAKDGDWFPQDWDGHFHGLMTARDALMESYNSPAIELLSRIGGQTGARYAQELGLAGILPEDGQSLGLAIGGIRGGVSPWEMAGAYAALAHGGLYAAPSLIDAIVDSTGRTLYVRSQAHSEVFSTQTAYLLTRMLQTVISSPFGTAYGLHDLATKGDVAGKTGTTDNNADAWFTGYTPRYTMSVWAGFDLPRPLPVHDGLRESLRPQWIFRDTLGPEITHRREHFPSLAGVRVYKICTKSGLLAGPLCQAAHEVEEDYLPEADAPQEICTLHRLVYTTWTRGKRYLATDLTPPGMVRQEVLLDRLPDTVDERDGHLAPLDSEESIPTAADPRGGAALSPAGL